MLRAWPLLRVGCPRSRHQALRRQVPIYRVVQLGDRNARRARDMGRLFSGYSAGSQPVLDVLAKDTMTDSLGQLARATVEQIDGLLDTCTHGRGSWLRKFVCIVQRLGLLRNEAKCFVDCSPP